MEQNANRIILHACCAICSAHPIEELKNSGYEVVVYFYNPNIFPPEEYERRLEAQKTLCENAGVELIVGEYEPEKFFEYVKGYEDCPEKGARCELCFRMRLEKTAEKARELGVSNFTTSIVISPHKNFKLLSEIGEKIASKTGLTYLALDFKKRDGFLKTNRIARELGLYRQNYCGCKFSQRVLTVGEKYAKMVM